MRTMWMAPLLIAACAKAPTEQTPAANTLSATPTGVISPTTPTDVAPTASVDPEAARWSKLAARLRAHDAKDLPDQAALGAFPDVAEGLAWIASNDPELFVRARALDAIGVWGAPDAVAVLQGALADTRQASNVRAGAVIGLGRLRDPAATTALLAVVEDADHRVAVEAVGVLAKVPSARDPLKAIALKPGLAPEVRAQIDAVP